MAGWVISVWVFAFPQPYTGIQKTCCRERRTTAANAQAALIRDTPGKAVFTGESFQPETFRPMRLLAHLRERGEQQSMCWHEDWMKHVAVEGAEALDRAMCFGRGWPQHSNNCARSPDRWIHAYPAMKAMPTAAITAPTA